MYRVYVLTNAEGLRYIGLSRDVARRLAAHNEGRSRWTKSRGPWALSWTSEPKSLTDARKLENLLKRQKGGDGLIPLLQLHGS